MTNPLEEVRRLAAAKSGLAVAVTVRVDGTPHVSVVNAGWLAHPLTGDDVVGFVVEGGAVKLRNLRRRPYGSIVFRAGWQWAARPRAPPNWLGLMTTWRESIAMASGCSCARSSPPPAERTRTSTSTTG